MFGTFDPLSFVTDVPKHEGRSLEELLAPPPLSGNQQLIGGAVIDASYVHRDPPLLARLAESGIPWVVNPQTVRFAATRFRTVAGLAQLPYAPLHPLDPTRFDARAKQMVRGALEFQAKHEPSMYLVPALPVTKVSVEVFRAFRELHAYAADLNGSATIPFRPMLAAAYPSYPVMPGRYGLFDRLDRTFAGSYVQPLQLTTRHDGVEKLVAYARFLQTASEAAAPVVAGRSGPFGLVLAAFGIDIFESSLDGGGSYSITRLERPRREPSEGKPRGGRAKAVYVEALRTAVPYTVAVELLGSSALTAQLSCLIGECRHGGASYALEHPRRHFFHVRQRELAILRAVPTAEYRVPIVLGWLRSAADLGQAVNRIREEQDKAAVDFGHLDRWTGVLARIATATIAEEGG